MFPLQGGRPPRPSTDPASTSQSSSHASATQTQPQAQAQGESQIETKARSGGGRHDDLRGLRDSLVDPQAPGQPSQGRKQASVPASPSSPVGSDEGERIEGPYLVGWALASHGQLVHIDLNGRRVSAAYADQDSGLQLAGTGQSASAVFSTGFCVCVGVVLVGPQHVGLAHTSEVDQDLPRRVTALQKEFRQETGSRVERTCLVRFEDSLRASLASDQVLDRKEFRSSYSTEIAHGRRLLSWSLPDGPPPANAKPTKIDAVVAHFREVVQQTATQCGASVLSVQGESLLVEADGRVSSFPKPPPFDPHEPTPPVKLEFKK